MVENTRVVATLFFDRLSANDLDGAMEVLADDCEVWIATAPVEAGREHTGTALAKPAFAGMMAQSRQLAPKGMQFVIHRSIVEGPEAALEVESRADLADGRFYNNRYTFLITVNGERITQLREYFDSKYASEFFLHLLQEK